MQQHCPKSYPGDGLRDEITVRRIHLEVFRSGGCQDGDLDALQVRHWVEGQELPLPEGIHAPALHPHHGA